MHICQSQISDHVYAHDYTSPYTHVCGNVHTPVYKHVYTHAYAPGIHQMGGGNGIFGVLGGMLIDALKPGRYISLCNPCLHTCPFQVYIHFYIHVLANYPRARYIHVCTLVCTPAYARVDT